MLALCNKTELVIVDTLEHEFLSSGDDSMLLLMRLAQFLTCGLILGTNVPVIMFILNQRSKTFLDWLIIFDCLLCLNNLFVVMLYIRSSDFEAEFCIFRVFSTFFTNLCNRLLTVGIAIYRVHLVYGSSLVRNSYQRKTFEKIIVLFILLFSFYLTGWAIYYREDYRSFLGISPIFLTSLRPNSNTRLHVQ